MGRWCRKSAVVTTRGRCIEWRWGLSALFKDLFNKPLLARTYSTSRCWPASIVGAAAPWDTALDAISPFLEEFGEVNGLLILGIIIMFSWVRILNSRIHKQYQQQLQDRQREIDRLAADNHEYRDRFLVLLDKRIQQDKDKS